MAKRPAFQFYPGDWRTDPGLRLCSLMARGLWIEMMAIMHEGEPYGHLTAQGRPISDDMLARLVGESPTAVRRAVKDLDANGVFSRTNDGIIFSRRMVRDEEIRNVRAAAGALGKYHGVKGKKFGVLGGNPKKKADYHEPGTLYAVQLVANGPIKIGITKYLRQRMNDYRRKHGFVTVLETFDVADMGAAEAKVHAAFDGRREGEWINAVWDEVRCVVLEVLNSGGRPYPPLQKSPHPTPSSSSSSPSPDIDDVDDEAHAIAIDVTALTDDLCRTAGVRHMEPGRINQHIDLVTEWLDRGATPDEIRAVIADAVAAASTPIHSLRYFDGAIRLMIAKKENFHGSAGAPPAAGAGFDNELARAVLADEARRRSEFVN